jgi:Domain of unknown function (DUF5071)
LWSDVARSVDTMGAEVEGVAQMIDAPTTAALRDLIPRDKFDNPRVHALVALGYPAIEPIMMDVLAWLGDMNWPVATELAPYLANIGAPLAPYIRRVFATNDDVWKYWLLKAVVAKSPDLALALQSDLERLAHRPTAGEKWDECDLEASEVLATLAM